MVLKNSRSWATLALILSLTSLSLVAFGQDQDPAKDQKPKVQTPKVKTPGQAKPKSKTTKTPAPSKAKPKKLDSATYAGIHKLYRRAFEDQMDKFGLSRIMPLKVHGPSLKALLTGKDKTVKESQLRPKNLELVTHLKSTVWALSTPKKGQKKEVKRSLTAFEKKALTSFKEDGKDVLVSADGQTMVGVLRAKRSCLNCHQAKKNQVLGALVYTFHSPKKAKAQPAANS